ncbi:hypothetical protein [Leptospira stimsonii]|uniref:Uncharacterized protein n=1 Tax=Leptospira stimsonii TaxID=2202203 RepID=A0ABY2MVD3_9LEPT|nr:hypothetical protein [Leptospira stimsonii]TGK25384.1 hypothetical protein EHO98_03010 [Leptospira stimsonii]TGM08803.1 hypothetical protein EHQ90_22195 [Leptospira stimsonii]
MAKKNSYFDAFNKDTAIGAGVTVSAMILSYMAQNFVPESMDTKKKLRPILIPILVALAAAFIPKKEYKPYAIIGAAIMLAFGLLKALDEEKSKDKRITGKLFGLDTLSGDPNEKKLQFNSLDEVKQFIDATQAQVNGSDGTVYEYATIADQTAQVNGEDSNALYGNEDGGLYGELEEVREFAGGLL